MEALTTSSNPYLATILAEFPDSHLLTDVAHPRTRKLLGEGSATDEVAKVVAYAARWGVSVVVVHSTLEPLSASLNFVMDDWHGAPSLGGGIYGDVVVVEMSVLGKAWTSVELLHEVSHVVSGWSPEDVDELESCMLAWEWYSVNLLGIKDTWDRFMSSFQLDNGLEWGSLSDKEQLSYVKRSLREAKRVGVLDGEGNPTYRSATEPNSSVCQRGWIHESV